MGTGDVVACLTRITSTPTYFIGILLCTLTGYFSQGKQSSVFYLLGQILLTHEPLGVEILTVYWCLFS